MRFTSTVPVAAPPAAVFALINDVERVATCMPGAVLSGRDGDAWQGGVKVKVGPITAAYSGTVRFLEVDEANRRLRVQARGTDTHGSGDAEAEVTVLVADAPGGARLDLATDLVIRGKIAQFGKGAITAVSDRILQQFARNLGGLLDAGPAPSNATTAVSASRSGDAAPGRLAASEPAPAAASHQASTPASSQASTQASASAPTQASAAEFTPVSGPELDGFAMVAGPALAKYAKYAPVLGAFAFGVFEGWLLGRLASVERQLKAARGGTA
ncbi:SRPBCC family protein [Streptodolium elevatio]|uniref:SRPBCC family protein n=1 Tax=Streptodolium elevatio TaxID=3157996 RepID=A0ABV3DAF1_9ACTN